MRNLIISILSLLTLTACGGSNADGNTSATSNIPVIIATCPTDINECDDNTESFTVTDTLGTITVDTQNAPNLGNYESLTAVALASDDVTLPAIAVLFNDTTDYTRIDGVTWLVNDEINAKGLNIARTATLSRTPLDSDPYPTVKLTFNSDNTIAEIYADETYTDATVDRSTIFGFNSAYMAYVTWGSSQTVADLDDSLTTDTLTNIGGMMIAGIETTDTSIFTAGRVDFTGKGKGVYGDATQGYETIFNVTANIDFDDNMVAMTIDSTACTSDCSGVTVPSYFDFSTGDISYTENSISQAITLDTALTGQLDARFYGGTSDEFGGTFIFAETDTRYYYGAFGASRNGIEPFVPSNMTALSAFNAAGVAAENPVTTNPSATMLTGNLTLKGLAVGLNDVAIYTRYKDDLWVVAETELQIDRQITANYVTDSGVAIDFDADTVTTIFADKDYTAGNTDAITVDRKDVFGFAANSDYMALVTWGKDETFDANNANPMMTTETITNIGGMMIAGIETTDTSIFTAGRVDFTGKGKGVYGDATQGYETIFNVTANIDFDDNMVAMTIDSTACTSDCSGVTVPSYFDFSTGDISYTENSISQAITLDTALTGQLDARFYGGTSDEFGGTFIFAETDTRYYYGAFGASRNGIEPFVPSNMTALSAFNAAGVAAENPVTTNPSATTLTGNLTLKGLAVGLNDVAIYTRYKDDLWVVAETELQIDRQITANYVTDSGVAIDFDADTVTTIFADKDYTAGNTDAITVDRKDVFGFAANSDYMALVTWGKDETFDANNANPMMTTETISNIGGMMIAGIETADASIYDAGITDFTGKGAGIYGTKTESFGTVFAITANVNFTARDMLLTTTTEACTDCNDFDVSTLDWTDLSLGFANDDNTDSVNSISQAITLDSTLTGRLDARFYGGTSDDFGGTFALAETDARYYYGAFGAERGYVISSKTLLTTHNDTPTTFNDNNLTGFNDANRVSTTGNALEATAVQIIKNSTNKKINADIITGAVVELDYASDGDFALLRLYFTDGKYSTNNTNEVVGNEHSISSPDSFPFFVIDKGLDYFINYPDYMAAFYWESTTNITVYGMTGFETMGSSIPNSGSNIDFDVGRGHGRYHSSTVDTPTYFRVSAIVNPTARTIDFSTSMTCMDLNIHACNKASSQLPHLNLTGTLSYEENINIITGDVETAGDANNLKITGTADARFYGPAFEEFGGTFRVSNKTSGYIGYFGAE